MTQNNTLARVRQVMREQLGVEEADAIADDQELFYDAGEEGHNAAKARGAAGLDSLDRAELIMSLEDEFSVEIPDDDVVADDGDTETKFNSIAGIVAYLDGAYLMGKTA